MDTPWQQDHHQLPFRLERSNDCLLIRQPVGQHKVTAVVCVALGLVIAATAWLLPEAAPAAAVLQLALLTFGLALLIMAIVLPLSAVKVTVNPSTLTRSRSVLDRVLFCRAIGAREVRSVEIDRGTRGYRICCAGSFGEFLLLDHLPARHLAEALRAEILATAGLTRTALANP